MSGPMDLRERAAALAWHAEVQRTLDGMMASLKASQAAARARAEADGFTATEVYLVASGSSSAQHVAAIGLEALLAAERLY